MIVDHNGSDDESVMCGRKYSDCAFFNCMFLVVIFKYFQK